MPWQQYLPESSFLVALHSIKWEHPSQQAKPTTHGLFPPAVQLAMQAMDVLPAQLEHGKTTLILPFVFHAHLEQTKLYFFSFRSILSGNLLHEHTVCTAVFMPVHEASHDIQYRQP